MKTTRFTGLLFFVGIAISSCSLIGINLNRKSPAQTKAYPKFKQADSLIGYLNPQRSCYRPYFYNLKVSFDIPKKSISGSNTIYLEANSDFVTLQIDLYPELKISSLRWIHEEVGAETKISEDLSFNRKMNAVWVTFPRTIRSGERLQLHVEYHGKPPVAKRPPWEGGFVWKKDKQGRPFVGVACEKLGASLWWPLKDHLSAEPDSVRTTFLVPKELYCVSNGTLTDSGTIGSQRYYSYFVSYPINPYNLTFYLGHFRGFRIPYDRDGVKQLEFQVLDYNYTNAKTHLLQTKKVISTFENLYGEYPYWRDQYKLVESPFEGMEHQTAIAYGNGYRNNMMGWDYIILHESAHEWWGNAVSVNDYADIWIHEGLATYSEALFFEKIYGFPGYRNLMIGYALTIRNQRPVVGPRDVNFWNYRDSDPYTKGALMMHSLRLHMQNDSLFFNIIQTFYERNKHKLVNSSDFIRLVNELSGESYDWFFNQYLYRHQPPKLEWIVTQKKGSEEFSVDYRWTQTAADFKMDIVVKNADGMFKRIHPTTQWQTYTGEGKQPDQPDLNAAYYALKKATKK